ncbi:T9SS type A sorting domain-containing protein [Aestuariibaculum lutulentum]|uniref:T9SS type A sorting domain-containing protein n=1 Tax=Aestuariibaculum lutulentum TaxID=2920935 RepID=A0ABS9RLL0_9FLAO|nr:T9SS type A sorting domain-containing protein [Aestuariibaculum lutulentum]MCH4553843.1 T9SS type A sorting domain-containing protein [Aestuariibaculum lutulentum]
MRKQITFLLFALFFALASSDLIAQKNVLYILSDGVKIYNDDQVGGTGYSTNASDTSYGIITKSSLLYNDPVSRMLKADSNFNVVTIIAKNGAASPDSYVSALDGTVPVGNTMTVDSGIDQTGFDLIIVTENVATYNFMKVGIGALTPANIQAPIIYSKPLHFRNNNTIASATAKETKTLGLSMEVVDASSPLFTGLGLTNGDDIPFFLTTSDDYGKAGGNRSIDVINNLEITSDGSTPVTNTLLATVPEITSPDQAIGINYFPAGTHLGTDATGILAQDAVALPFSWGATVKQDGGNITPQLLTVWRNAAYQLTGLSNPGGLVSNDFAGDYEVVTTTYYHDFRGGNTSSFLGNVTTEGTLLENISRFSNTDGTTELNNLVAYPTGRFMSDGDNPLSPSIGYVQIRNFVGNGDNYYNSTLGLNLKAGSEFHIKTLSGGKVTVPLMSESTLDYIVNAPNFNNKGWGSVDGSSLVGPSTVAYDATIDGARGTDFTFEYYGNPGGIDFKFVVDGTGGGTDMYLPYIQVDFDLLRTKPKKVLYVNQSGVGQGAGASAPGDDPVIRMLMADSNLEVTYIETPQDGSAIPALSGFDVVIAQENISSGAAMLKPGGVLGVKDVTIPIIYNKTWAFRNTRAITDADATVSATQNVSVTATNTSHPLFTGIDFSGGNDIRIFSEATANDDGSTGGNKGIDILNNLEISSTDAATIATVPEVTDAAKAFVINYIPSGTQLGEDSNDVLSVNAVALSFSYGATIMGDGANISPEALTIWRNAVYLLTGQTPPATMVQNADFTLSIDKAGEVSKVSTNVRAMGNYIYITDVKSQTDVKIYSLTGALVKEFKTNEDVNFSFRSGIYIATVKTFEGSKAVKILVK